MAPSNEAEGRRAKPTLKHLFYLTRPYSWVCSTAVAVAAWLLAGGAAQLLGLWIPLLLSALLWVGLNWLSDSIQRDAGRTPPSRTLVTIVVVASLGFAAFFSASAFVWAGIHYALVLAYAQKKVSPKVGAISYLFRGGTVFAACAAASAAANGAWSPTGDAFWFIASQSLAHAARNLIGDIRDMKDDRYELLATHGATRAAMVAVACLLAAGVAAAMLTVLRRETISFVVVLLIGVFLLIRYGGRIGYEKAGRRLHHVMVVAFSIFTLYCSFHLGVWWLWVVLGSAFLVALHRTYKDNPGKGYRGNF